MIDFFASFAHLFLTILVFLLIFGSLIILHEFGHFWAARAAKVKVLEFGIGLPPKVFTKKTTRMGGNGKKETMEWTINALPFGGFVRMLGEEGASKDPYAFVNRPWGWKVLVICGGVIMNFLIGWFLLAGLFWHGTTPSYSTLQEYEQLKNDGYFTERTNALYFSGNPENLKLASLQNGDIITNVQTIEEVQMLLQNAGNTVLIDRWNAETKSFSHHTIEITKPIQASISRVIIENTLSGSVAEQLGLRKNDVITAFNGEKIYSLFDISKILKSLPVGTKTSLTILRNHSESIDIEFLVPENKMLGIYGMQNQDANIFIAQANIPFVIKNQSFGMLESIQKGFISSFSVLDLSWKMLEKMMQKVSEEMKVPDEMGGPISIAHTTGQILEFGNISNLIQFAAMISLSLAFMNILPIPGLDGGRLIFLLLDGVFILKKKLFSMLKLKNYGGEKIPATIEGYFHIAGYFFLLSLLIIISWNDIVKILW